MPTGYEAAPTRNGIAGRIFNADVLVVEDFGDETRLYESVDALVADIWEYPKSYGIDDEIVRIGLNYLPTPYTKEQYNNWRYNNDDIVVWTTCDAEDVELCGAIYEGKWYCEWHNEVSFNYKWRDMVSLVTLA